MSTSLPATHSSLSLTINTLETPQGGFGSYPMCSNQSKKMEDHFHVVLRIDQIAHATDFMKPPGVFNPTPIRYVVLVDQPRKNKRLFTQPSLVTPSSSEGCFLSTTELPTETKVVSLTPDVREVPTLSLSPIPPETHPTDPQKILSQPFRISPFVLPNPEPQARQMDEHGLPHDDTRSNFCERVASVFCCCCKISHDRSNRKE